MSSRSYEVRFSEREASARIRLAVQRMEHRKVSERRRKTLANLEWKPIAAAEFSIPDELLEVELPNEWTTKDGIEGERIFLSPENDSLTVMLSDANLPEESCEEVVRRFVQDIYEKAMGRSLSKNEIKVSGIAVLTHYCCEFCSGAITEFAYSCPVCGRCFCYAHRRPESHGCAGLRSRTAQPESPVKVKERFSSSRSRGRPKVRISKVPCG